MPEHRSPLKEFRHLEEKLATVGLSPAEQARYRQLKEIVSPEATPRPGFDVNAAAEALKASLEPAGLRRTTPPAREPAPPDLGAPPPEAPPLGAGAPGYDPNAAAWDPNQPYDPNAAAWDPNAQPVDPSAQGYDPSAQPWDPNQPYDPNAAAWDPNAQPVDPGAQGYDPGAPPWDPNQPYDPNAAAWDPNAQPVDPSAQGYDPSAQPWDPNQPYDPNAAPWDPNAQPVDPSAQGYDPSAQPWDPNQPYDQNAPYGYAAPQPEATDLAGGAPPELDPGSGALNQGPVEAGPGAPAWDAAGNYDQAAWDAGVPAGPDPAVRSSDLGPEAFDAAALPPPEPAPGGYEQPTWDAAAWAAPPEPAAGPPEAEPIEADLVEADLVEAEPPPEAPAPGSDLFTPGPQTPDFTGAQPLDAGVFDQGEPALSGPAAAGWPEAEAATGEGQPAPAEAGFEPAEAGGPGAAEVGEPPGAIDLGPAVEAEGAAEPVPLASPSEFLSSFEPPTAPPADALGSGEVAIEELPPVEVDVEEIAETPEPAAEPIAPPPGAAARAPAPAPAALAPPDDVPPAPRPAHDLGGSAASFVAGEHRVVVHTLEGQVLRGTITDVDLDADSIPLIAGSGGASEPIAASRVKAIFFMLLPGGRPPAPDGRRVRVTFRDGRQVAGFSADYDPEAVGFFMVPADSRTNTGRIWVYRAAVRQVSVT